MFGPGRAGLGRGSAKKVVAGVACKRASWLIRASARASMEARGPGGLRSTAKRKRAGFVHHPEENVGLAGRGAPRRAGLDAAGWGECSRSRHPPGRSASSGRERGKAFGPGRVGLGCSSATKVVAGAVCKLAGWFIQPLAWASVEVCLPCGLRSAAKRKQAGFVDRQKNKNVGPAGDGASVGSVVECRGGPGPAWARWLRLGSAGRASCWPHRRSSIPGLLTPACKGRAPARGSSPRFRIWRRLGPRTEGGTRRPPPTPVVRQFREIALNSL